MDGQRKLMGLLVVGGLATLIGLSFWPQDPPSVAPQAYAQQTAESVEAQEQSIQGAEQLSRAFRTAAKAVKPSVVRIDAMIKTRPRRMSRPSLPPGFPFLFDDSTFEELQDDQQPKEGELVPAGVGSGVIVSEDGYILTNNHVVQEADELDVRLSDGRRFTGKVIGTDDRSDVAVVKIDATGLVPARLGDSSIMDVGDWVIAVGSPFELDQTVTAGIISALNRSVDILDYEDFLQTDAAINPGNSGGPLVNLRGQVIGINTAINSRSGSNAGVGFAIPSSMAKQIMDSLIKNGRVVRGFIGASLADLSLDAARAARLPNKYTSGVVIEKLLQGGPASKAGLQPGDVIVRIDGKPIRDGSAMRIRVSLTPVGQPINMSVVRDGKELDVSVVVEELTDEKLAKLSGAVEVPEWGITVGELTEELAKRLSVDPQDGGIVVLAVKERGKMSSYMRAGDIIMKINGTDIATPADLRKFIKSGQRMRVMFRRGNQLAMLEIQ